MANETLSKRCETGSRQRQQDSTQVTVQKPVLSDFTYYRVDVEALDLAHGKVTVKKFEMCPSDKDYPITFTQTLRTEDDIQIVEQGSLKTTVELGDNILASIDMKALESDGEYHQILEGKDHLCNILKHYLGDFGHELQASSGIEPGTCPIPAGEYSVKNHKLDFKKFKYQNVPKGELLIDIKLLDSKTDDIMGCITANVLLE